jgi:hypothetical protein
MSGSKIFAAVGGLTALLAAAGAGTALAAPCALGSEYPVTSVSPSRRAVQTGGYADNATQVLRGADIRVAARPGLTAEWLERQIESQVAAGECQFGGGPLSIDVLPDSDGFVVRVTTGSEGPGVTRVSERKPDDRAAREILRQAEALQRS